MEDRLLSVDHEGMAGIVSALEAHHHVGALGKEIHHLSFPLITPLCSNDRDIHRAVTSR